MFIGRDDVDMKEWLYRRHRLIASTFPAMPCAYCTEKGSVCPSDVIIAAHQPTDASP